MTVLTVRLPCSRGQVLHYDILFAVCPLPCLAVWPFAVR